MRRTSPKHAITGPTFIAIACLLLLASTAWAGRADESHGRHRAVGHDVAPRVVILETEGGVSHFTVTGTNADFGTYLALGEATFVAGHEEGVLLECTGVAVVQAENGNHIVADVTCQVTDHGFDLTFHWRDFVTFSNGSTVSNTGEFVDHRPPGLALSSISGLSLNGKEYRCIYTMFVDCGATSCRASCSTCCDDSENRFCPDRLCTLR